MRAVGRAAAARAVARAGRAGDRLTAVPTPAERASQSRGISNAAVHTAAAAALRARGARGIIVDVGCGLGLFREAVTSFCTRYIGVDVLRYDGLAADVDFRQADLDRDPLPLPDNSADVVASIETIEHLENPRAFCRELTRILRPGGILLISTPNQLSVLSLLTLVLKQRFSAFQDASYPAHRTALLEVDLRRIASECGLRDVTVTYTGVGRIPLTGRHYPAAISRRFPRALSDNVLLVATKHV